MKLSVLKKELTKVIDLVRNETDMENMSDQEVEHLINYAMYEILYLPKKKSATNKVVTSTDDRPCDTEASDNVIKVNFK